MRSADFKPDYSGGDNAIAIAFVPFVFIPPARLLFVISCAASAMGEPCRNPLDFRPARG